MDWNEGDLELRGSVGKLVKRRMRVFSLTVLSERKKDGSLLFQ